MKKFLSILLAALLAFGLCSCGEGGASGDVNDPGKDAPETPTMEITMEYVYNSEEAKEKAIITGTPEGGEVAWTYETPEVYESMYDTIVELGTQENSYYFACDGDIYCLNILNGEVNWVNEDYKGHGITWLFGDDGKLYLTSLYGPVLCVIDEKGNTEARLEDLYYKTETEQWPMGDSYSPYDIFANEDGSVTLYLDATGTAVTFDPKTGIISDEWLITQAVDKDFLVGSWVVDTLPIRFRIDIEEDLSYQMYLCDEDGITEYIYFGTVEQDCYDPEVSEGTDMVKFLLDEAKTRSLEGGAYVDEAFMSVETAGDYVVVWAGSDGERDYMMLGQVNNGDAVYSYYLEEYRIVLTKVDIAG